MSNPVISRVHQRCAPQCARLRLPSTLTSEFVANQRQTCSSKSMSSLPMKILKFVFILICVHQLRFARHVAPHNQLQFGCFAGKVSGQCAAINQVLPAFCVCCLVTIMSSASAQSVDVVLRYHAPDKVANLHAIHASRRSTSLR
jgi:hypothetical protein